MWMCTHVSKLSIWIRTRSILACSASASFASYVVLSSYFYQLVRSGLFSELVPVPCPLSLLNVQYSSPVSKCHRPVDTSVTPPAQACLLMSWEIVDQHCSLVSVLLFLVTLVFFPIVTNYEWLDHLFLWLIHRDQPWLQSSWNLFPLPPSWVSSACVSLTRLLAGTAVFTGHFC